MKLEITSTETVTKTIEIEIPSFYKNSIEAIGFYSQECIITIMRLSDGWLSIRKCKLDDTEKKAGYLKTFKKITEDEFANELLRATSEMEYPTGPVKRENILVTPLAY